MHKTTTFKPPLLTVSDSCHLDAVFISFSFLRFSLISKNIDMSPPANIIHFCVHPRPPPPISQRSVIYLATIVFLSPKQKPAPENQPIGGRWFPPNRKISRQNSFPGVARGGGGHSVVHMVYDDDDFFFFGGGGSSSADDLWQLSLTSRGVSK